MRCPCALSAVCAATSSQAWNNPPHPTSLLSDSFFYAQQSLGPLQLKGDDLSLQTAVKKAVGQVKEGGEVAQRLLHGQQVTKAAIAEKVGAFRSESISFRIVLISIIVESCTQPLLYERDGEHFDCSGMVDKGNTSILPKCSIGGSSRVFCSDHVSVPRFVQAELSHISSELSKELGGVVDEAQGRHAEASPTHTLTYAEVKEEDPNATKGQYRSLKAPNAKP